MTTLPKSRRDDPYHYLVELLRTLGPEEAFKLFLRIYPGKVVDNKDPKKLGRVRVMVPAFGQTDPGDVPGSLWARPVHPTGLFSPPYVGDIVHVWTISGRPEDQVFLGASRIDEENPLSHESAMLRGFVTKAGHHLAMDDSADDLKIRIVHGDGSGEATGSEIQITRDGDVILSRSQDGGTVNEVRVSSAGVAVTRDQSRALVTSDAITLEAGGCSIEMSGGTVTIRGSSVVLDGTRVLVNGDSVGIGRNAMEPALKGTTVSALWRAHVHATAGPGSPTVPGSAQPAIAPGNGLSSVVRIA